MADDMPHLPKGVVFLLRNIIGVNPEDILPQMKAAFDQFTGFCTHFDKRMVSVSEQLEALRKEVASLKASQSPAQPETTDNATDDVEIHGLLPSFAQSNRCDTSGDDSASHGPSRLNGSESRPGPA